MGLNNLQGALGHNSMLKHLDKTHQDSAKEISNSQVMELSLHKFVKIHKDLAYLQITNLDLRMGIIFLIIQLSKFHLDLDLNL